jgi:serine O-acetyltransferase
VVKPVPAGATAVGNPAHLVKKEHADSGAAQLFAAYGVTANGDDPISKVLHKLIDNAAAQQDQIEKLSAALKAAGIACSAQPQAGKIDPDQINSLVD